MTYIYGDAYRKHLREKLMNTRRSFLILARRDAGDIV
jgi:hypothetical protein